MNSHQRRIAKRIRQRRTFRVSNAKAVTLANIQLGSGSALYRAAEPHEKPKWLADVKPISLGIDLASEPDLTAIQMTLNGNLYTLRTRHSAYEIAERLKPGTIVNIAMGKDDKGASYRIRDMRKLPTDELFSLNLERLPDEQSSKTN